MGRCWLAGVLVVGTGLGSPGASGPGLVLVIGTGLGPIGVVLGPRVLGSGPVLITRIGLTSRIYY